MSQCPSCGVELPEGVQSCTACGWAPAAPEGPAAGSAAAPMAAPMAAAAGGPPPVVVVRKESSPGIATAGFVLVLVGLFVPLVGLVGFILSILGYRQAKREGLPTGLGLAGTIIGAIATVLGILFLLFFIGAIAVSSETSVDMGLLLQAWC